MAYKLYITADNKEEWQSLLPSFLTESYEEEVPSELYGYTAGYTLSTFNRFYVNSSSLGLNCVRTEFERVNENIPRVAGYLVALSDEGGAYIELSDDKERIENTGNGFISFENNYAVTSGLTNLNFLDNYMYGNIPATFTLEPTLDQIENIALNPAQIGTGTNTRLFLNYVGTKCDRFIAECNIPIFDSYENARNYISNGTIRGLLNGESEGLANYPKEYYFEEFIQRYENPDFTGEKKTVERIRNYFFADENNYRIVGYIKQAAGSYYNIVFKASAIDAESSVFFGTHVKDGGTRTPLTVALFNLGSNEWNRGLKGSKEVGDYTYYAAPNTNIPIVGSKKEAESYLNREKDIDELKQVKLNDSNVNVKHTGDDTADQTEQVLNQGYGEPLLSTQYICTNSEMDAIANILFTQTDSTETALAEGLKRYGENPINDVIDIYHTPIDLSDFITVSAGNRVRFGSYWSEATASRITAHGNIKTLGTANIMPVFNDFRDYDGTLEIELYLPFAGTMPLDIHSYMNRALTIKATADTRAHNIRYYLFSDGALMTFRDCAFGKSISMMGNDVAAKYHQNISSEIGINASERSLALTAFGTGVSMASGNFKAGLGGIMSLAQGVSNLEAQREMQSLDRYHTQAPRTFAGSQSAGCSESDILYPYLIFRIQQSYTPDNLLETFGRPCNIINKIGNFSGYTQIENAHLETSATLEEINEINSLLTRGIIL